MTTVQRLLMTPFLVILAALMACSGATPTSDPTETPAPASIAATTGVTSKLRGPGGDNYPVADPWAAHRSPDTGAGVSNTRIHDRSRAYEGSAHTDFHIGDSDFHPSPKEKGR